MMVNARLLSAINATPEHHWKYGINAMKQLALFSEWISGDEYMPEPGQEVFKYYLGENGEPVGPIVSTPIHRDGSHLYNGKSIYRKCLWWMPIPSLPETGKQNQ